VGYFSIGQFLLGSALCVFVSPTVVSRIYQLSRMAEDTLFETTKNVAVARWSRSTKLTYVGPGYYRATVSGFSSRCQTFISVRNQPPRPTQPSIPPETINDDLQLRLGGKMQAAMVHSVSG